MAQKVGLFIAFEGSEGCGKSTQSHRVYLELQKEGYDVAYTKEPGDTALGQRIRDILLTKDNEIKRLNEIAELLLFEADRAQHVEQVIKPALMLKKIVICDRYNAATFAYQGYGLGIDLDLIKRIDDAATGGLSPDLTVIMDVDVKTGLERAGHTGFMDRMEKRELEFHQKVRKGYLDLAERSPENIKVIEVKNGIEETYKEVKEKVYDIVAKYKGSE